MSDDYSLRFPIGESPFPKEFDLAEVQKNIRALAECNPTIKPYAEEEWANLCDYDDKMIEPSLALLQALHCKWVYLLGSLSEKQWRRTFFHPGNNQVTSIFQHTAIYAWHGRHHLEHIKIASKKSEKPTENR